MRDADEHAITGTVLDRFAETPDPCLKTLVQALARHPHGFVREVEPSFEEWQAALEVLTRTGQMCSGTR